MIRVKRNYRVWVANETLEDYSLRYAPRAYRRWSPYLVANTALGGISFLALEAIGGAVMLSYGFANAFPAILFACAVIFLTALPISYYASEYNIDMDLLTRGAGFGYIGSTITSLIYASFTFIFFALEAAIMAQALHLYFGLHLVAGYLISSLVIIPITLFGITLINRLQLLTQPPWLLLLVTPFVLILAKEPTLLAEWSQFAGREPGAGEWNGLLFGAATGVLFSLVVQVGEQVDYLRFLPDRERHNRGHWWAAMLLAGPGWILLGGAKILAGGLLAFVVVRNSGSDAGAVEPIRMYTEAYSYVFSDPAAVLAVATLFVILSQIKINVTNAYAGSLAWGNFFSRVTHYHPGRVVWLVFNVIIALLLMLLGIFETLESVLAVYANVAIAWIGAIVADLVVLKPLGVSPPFIEFKRAHLYNVNPVGCGAMLVASGVSTLAWFGAFGELAQVYSACLSLVIALLLAVLIGVVTGGRYYIARASGTPVGASEPVTCCICERRYDPRDTASCPFYEGPICSLCCTLDTHCHDICKASEDQLLRFRSRGAPSLEQPTFSAHAGRRVVRFLVLFSVFAIIAGAVFLISLRLIELPPGLAAGELDGIFLRLYLGSLALLAVAAWWTVLSHESRELAESELVNSLQHLEQTQKDLVDAEKMACLGGLVAGVAHEISTPVGITVSAASYLEDRVRALRDERAAAATGRGDIGSGELDRFLDDARQSARLILANAERAAGLLKSFREVAVDRATEERRQFDLARLLAETADSLGPRLRETRHRIEISARKDVLVDSYPGPLGQAITNIALNALQHAFDQDRHGLVRIEAEAASEDRIRVTIADDGRGIPAGLAQRIFEPFFTTCRGSGGTGLGLHIAYNLVTYTLGGSIRLDSGSGYGRGARFVLEFPRRAPSVSDAQG